MCTEAACKCSVSLQVVINGGATSSGEQDNEDTELMAIYTTENGIAEKVAPVQRRRRAVRGPCVVQPSVCVHPVEGAAVVRNTALDLCQRPCK